MHSTLPFRSTPSVIVAGPAGVRTFADRLVQQSRACPTDRILIVGNGRCGLILELCRRGFTEVCHETGDRLPTHEAFDVVWLLRLESAPALGRVVGALSRMLRPGGTVVAWTAPSPTMEAEAPSAQDVRQCFAACGLVPLIQASDGEDGHLLTAHRPLADAAAWLITA